MMRVLDIEIEILLIFRSFSFKMLKNLLLMLLEIALFFLLLYSFLHRYKLSNLSREQGIFKNTKWCGNSPPAPLIAPPVEMFAPPLKCPYDSETYFIFALCEIFVN